MITVFFSGNCFIISELTCEWQAINPNISQPSSAHFFFYGYLYCSWYTLLFAGRCIATFWCYSRPFVRISLQLMLLLLFVLLLLSPFIQFCSWKSLIHPVFITFNRLLFVFHRFNRMFFFQWLLSAVVHMPIQLWMHSLFTDYCTKKQQNKRTNSILLIEMWQHFAISLIHINNPSQCEGERLSLRRFFFSIE